MNDETMLRQKARELIQAGKLPNRRAERTWGGPGEGNFCAICGKPVKRNEVELEVEFVQSEDKSELDQYHVHVPCFAAWESERRNLRPAGTAKLPADQPRSTPGIAPGPFPSSSVTATTDGTLPEPIEVGKIAVRECDTTYRRRSE